MFITRKRLQEMLEDERRKTFDEAFKREEENRRINYIHDRIDRLERKVYELEGVPDPNAVACAPR